MRSHTMFFAPAAYHASFHTGAWRALTERGLDSFECLGGGSVGSILAFALAAGATVDEFDAALDTMASTWSLTKGWGCHVKVLRPVIQGFIDSQPSPTWLRDAFAVVTTAHVALPPVVPRFAKAPPIEDHEGIKRLLLASCHIAPLFEGASIWNGVPAVDGGAFLMSLTMPGVVTSSPWTTMSEDVIAPARPADIAAKVGAPARDRPRTCRSHTIRIHA